MKSLSTHTPNGAMLASHAKRVSSTQAGFARLALLTMKRDQESGVTTDSSHHHRQVLSCPLFPSPGQRTTSEVGTAADRALQRAKVLSSEPSVAVKVLVAAVAH